MQEEYTDRVLSIMGAGGWGAGAHPLSQILGVLQPPSPHDSYASDKNYHKATTEKGSWEESVVNAARHVGRFLKDEM